MLTCWKLINKQTRFEEQQGAVILDVWKFDSCRNVPVPAHADRLGRHEYILCMLFGNFYISANMAKSNEILNKIRVREGVLSNV